MKLIDVLIKLAKSEMTVVALTNGNNGNYFRVRETPEEIIQLIKQAKEL
ncbi:hypothetical protein [Enterococcus cecorum]